MRWKIRIVLGITCLMVLIQGIAAYFMLTEIRSVEAELNRANASATQMVTIQKSHYSWVQNLTLHIFDDVDFTGSLDMTPARWAPGSTATPQSKTPILNSRVM